MLALKPVGNPKRLLIRKSLVIAIDRKRIQPICSITWESFKNLITNCTEGPLIILYFLLSTVSNEDRDSDEAKRVTEDDAIIRDQGNQENANINAN